MEIKEHPSPKLFQPCFIQRKRLLHQGHVTSHICKRNKQHDFGTTLFTEMLGRYLKCKQIQNLMICKTQKTFIIYSYSDTEKLH